VVLDIRYVIDEKIWLSASEEERKLASRFSVEAMPNFDRPKNIV